ncbi:MAG: class I SAM-dependent RNA methyltransferase [Deltaproteobacteria bacterium]|nr:class I SAM-dependent RNA methyltransferase [Deltaproteobacteria bacterium]
MFAVTQPGLENICARNLVELGIENVKPLEGGIEFQGGLQELYQANLWLRAASRILVRVGTFKCRDFPTLYKKALQIPWGRFIRPGTRFRVQASSHSSRLLHSDRISETIEAAISHSLGISQTTSNGPQQTVLARLDQNHCLLSVDSSGDLLHRRGYRESAVAAPLRETLAAGILGMLNWHGEMPLLDPMCGSGTFPIEAALLATNRPPGARRSFAFMNWPHYRPGLWNSLLEASTRQIRGPASSIFASDRDPRAVEATRHNAGNTQVGEEIDIRQASLSELEAPAETGLILCNPPYGKRIYEENDPITFYREMGKIYRRNFRGWILGLVCPPELAKATGLPLEKIAGFRNGGIKIQLFRVLL